MFLNTSKTPFSPEIRYRVSPAFRKQYCPGVDILSLIVTLINIYISCFILCFLDTSNNWRNSSSYPCPNDYCTRVYKFKCSLSRHLYYECGKPPMYECQYCPKKCSLRENLKKHVIAMHLSKLPTESDFDDNARITSTTARRF